MEREKIKAIIENLLLVSDQPVTLNKLVDVINIANGREEIKAAIRELMEDYSERNLQIQEVAEGYQLCTRSDYADWIKKFYKLDRGAKLSPAGLDTLSIIAYKQPITRAEIEDIRGVDSGGVIKTLFEKKLLRPMGRKQVVGRPMLYGTSNKFLEYFGLRHISELPTLKEFSEKEEEMDQQPLQTDLPFERKNPVEEEGKVDEDPSSSAED